MVFKKYKFSFLLVFILAASNSNGQILCKKNAFLMGGTFEFSVIVQDTMTGYIAIEECITEIRRIENLLSDWIPASQVSQVNKYAGMRAIRVDREVFRLTQQAFYFSEITLGSFDISFAAMDRIWRFDGSMDTMPSAEAVARSVENVGYKNILLDSMQSTIFLKKEGMKIGFGALGEGYAVDRCRAMMIRKGITSGLINATGDIAAWGIQADGMPWRVGIRNPFKKNRIIKVLPIHNEAVTTSGSYEKYVEFDGKRFSHIINPKTGYPATGLTSVTVIGPDALTSNFLSTSIMVLGRKAGLKLLKTYPTYKAILITDRGRVIRTDRLGR